MQKISIVSLKQTEAMINNGAVFAKFETNSLDSCDHSSDYSNDDENYQQNANTSAERKEVKRRQRLTHLTVEEKINRRKLKNRMAAQSARDRKKLRMEELEQELVQVKAQNEKLKSENTLLKENTKTLLEENRKLLKYKADTLLQQKEFKSPENDQINDTLNAININSVNSQMCVIGSSLKRKLNSSTLAEVADESAVFFKIVSQPKKQQLQLMLQKFICVLILYTMNLLRKETSLLNQKEKKPHYPPFSLSDQDPRSQRSILMKITKLKLTLLNLVKLLKYCRQRAPNLTASQMALIKNNPILRMDLDKLPSPSMTMNLSVCKLTIFVSLMTKLMRKKF